MLMFAFSEWLGHAVQLLMRPFQAVEGKFRDRCRSAAVHFGGGPRQSSPRLY